MREKFLLLMMTAWIAGLSPAAAQAVYVEKEEGPEGRSLAVTVRGGRPAMWVPGAHVDFLHLDRNGKTKEWRSVGLSPQAAKREASRGGAWRFRENFTTDKGDSVEVAFSFRPHGNCRFFEEKQ